MNLHIICVAYQRPIPMRILIDSFMVQTNPNWSLNIIHDGEPTQEVNDIASWYQDKRVNFFNSKKRNGNYGHPNRRMMLNNLKVPENDYILMTNDDNYYAPCFVEMMLSRGSLSVGMIYCDMLHNYYSYDVLKTKLQINHIDMGAFIVKAKVAKEVGFNSTKFEADGIYAEECKAKCEKSGYRIVYVPKPIFIHN